MRGRRHFYTRLRTDTDVTTVLDTAAAGGLVLKGGMLRLVGFLATTLVAFLGVAIAAHLLGPTQFGRYQTVVSLTTIVAAVTDAGITTLAIREYAQAKPAERDELMRSLLGLRLALATAGAALTTVIVALSGYGAGYVAGAAAAGAGVTLLAFKETLAIPLAVTLRNGWLASLDLVRQSVTTALFVASGLLGAGAPWFLAATMPAALVVLVVTAGAVRGQISLRPRMQWRLWAGLIRQVVAFSMASAVGTVYIYTAQVLTSFVSSGGQAGLFAASFRLYAVVVSVAGVLVAVAFPVLARAARDDRERLAYALQRLFEVCSMLGIGCAVATVVGAPTIIDLLAGNAFAGAVTPLRIEALAMLASFLAAPLGFGLLAIHHHRALLVVNAAALAVCIVAVSALAATEGARGAAIASLLGEVTLSAGYFVALVRADPTLRPDLARPLRALLAAGPAVAVMLIPLPVVPATALALGIYAAGVVLTRAAPEELLNLVRR